MPPAVAAYIDRHGLYRDPALLPPNSPPPRRAAPLTTTAHVIKTSLPNPPPPVETPAQDRTPRSRSLKAKDVVEIDVRGKSSVCDYMVIASARRPATSSRWPTKWCASPSASTVMPLGVEGEREAEWVLVDLGDVVVHVMPRVREFYALERLWTVGTSRRNSSSNLPRLALHRRLLRTIPMDRRVHRGCCLRHARKAIARDGS